MKTVSIDLMGIMCFRTYIKSRATLFFTTTTNLGECNEFCTGAIGAGVDVDDPKSMLCRDFGNIIDAGNTGLGTLLMLPSLLKREFIDDSESISAKLCRCFLPFRIT